MNGPVKLVAVVAGIVLVSAVLAPPLHAVLPFPFVRIFTRVLMITAIIGAAVFVRFRKGLFARVGLAWTPDSVRLLWTGFLSGFATLVVFALVSVATGHAHFATRQLSAFQWTERIAEGLVTGILIGVLEEFLFRGVVFTCFRDSVFRGRILPGMAVTSAVYAFLHFLHVRQPVISPDPGFADSLRLILATVQSLADWPTAWPSAVGLFLFGMVLNCVLVRTGSLYPSIGLHAGCVTFLRVIGLFFSFEQAGSWLWSTKLVYGGAAGCGFLLLIGVVLRLLKRAGPAT